LKARLNPRRCFVSCMTAFLVGAFSLPTVAQSAEWPNQPIRIIVPFTAGGSTDTVARIMANELSPRLGQPVIVENRAGAGGTIGTAAGAKAPPDGNTLILATSSTMGVSPNLYKDLQYDPAKDFAPVTLLGTATILMALHPSVEAGSVQEVIELAKKNPGMLTFASGGIGSISHLVGEYFKLETGADMLHVPYRGDTEMLADLVGGRLSMAFGTAVAYLPYVQKKQLKALAVTNPERSAILPDLPTVSEEGVAGFSAIQYFGLLAPAGTPPAIVDRLQKESLAILKLPAVQERLTTMGFDIVGNTPTEFASFLKADYDKWRTIIRESGTTISSK
jgi:tripartite-type tricarboxylate transporter receptor subunit TctC